MNLPAGLLALYRAAESAAVRFGGEADGVLGSCGLFLCIPPERNYYERCTPTNVLTFAYPGVDGVHYSYVHSGLPAGQAPIVMTLPMALDESIVIAEDFDEFFALGYHAAWFGLEQLHYGPQSAVEYFAKPDLEQPEYMHEILHFLHEALAIRPAPPNLSRLRELNERFHESLVIPKPPGT